MSGDALHRMWAVLSVSAATGCLVDAVLAKRRALRRRRRLTALTALPGTGAGPRAPSWSSAAVGLRRLPARDAAVMAGALALGTVLVGGVAGGLFVLAAAYGLRRWSRGRADRTGRGRGDGGPKTDAKAAERRVTGQLPIAAELLAACLAAGSGPREAAGAVGGAVGGPLGERLVRASAELRLGGDPAAVWERLGELPGAAGLARCLERTGTTGVPAAEPMGRLAAECR
ncbi:MAG TPA: type II secretion system F family protein, partial [Streptomyces sp.]|nr:type II secretion system F family protein [Streptomyces sp.]